MARRRESFRGNAKTVPKVVLRDVHDTWSTQCVLKHNVIEMARCDVWTSYEFTSQGCLIRPNMNQTIATQQGVTRNKDSAIKFTQQWMTSE